MNNRLESLRQLMSENPDDPFFTYAIALEKHKEGDIMEAVELLEELATRQPDYLGTYYQLGKFYEEIAEIDKAIDIYRKGIRVAKSQNDTRAHREMSEALFYLEEGE